MATYHSPSSYSRWSRWHWNYLQAYWQVLIYSLGPTGFLNQENIPGEYVPPACADPVCYNRHQISAPVEGSEVNTFEQISIMARGPCTVRSKQSRVMVTWDPHGQNDWLMERHDWKHYLPATSLVRSTVVHFVQPVSSIVSCNRNKLHLQ